MAYIALYWHILCLYFRRFILNKRYEPVSIRDLELPLYDKAQHLQKSNQIWRNLSKELQVELRGVAAALQDNPIYISLVEEARVEIKYLPLLSAISEGITRLHSGGIEYNFAQNKSISYLKKGLEELSFFEEVLFLVRHWILPYQLYVVYEAYIKAFGYYGGSQIKVLRGNEATYKIPFHYNLIPALLHLHPAHPQLLEEYYDSKRGENFSSYYKSDYLFPFLSERGAFQAQIKTIVPFHKSINKIEMTVSALAFINDFDKERVEDFKSKYQYKCIVLIGIVGEYKFAKLLALAERLEKKEMYLRPFIRNKFGRPFLMLVGENGQARIKVYLKSENHTHSPFIAPNQKIRVAGIFSQIDASGLLIFEEGLIHL